MHTHTGDVCAYVYNIYVDILYNFIPYMYVIINRISLQIHIVDT